MVDLPTANLRLVCRLALSSAIAGLVTLGPAALAQEAGTDELPSESSMDDATESAPLRIGVSCPADLDLLTQGLLRDLPGYANRVSQRSSGPFRNIQRPGFVLLTGQPDLRPLPLNDWGREPPTPQPDELYQVFFTTRERSPGAVNEYSLQRYHWAFLTRSDTATNDWYLAFMYSRIGTYPDTGRPESPLEETTHSAVGQGIQLWLRDCRAEAIDPIEAIDLNPVTGDMTPTNP